MAHAENDTDAEAYKRWKQGIPLLYDWFVSHHLPWPSLTCRCASMLGVPQKLLHSLYFS